MLTSISMQSRQPPSRRRPLGVDVGAQIGKLGGHLHLRDAVTDSDAAMNMGRIEESAVKPIA
jgi:hypothetical protein